MSFLINGQNTLNTWNVDIGSGANISLLAPPVFKDRYEHDWGDENGTEYLDEEVLYKRSQTHTLNCVIANVANKQVAVEKYKSFISYITDSKGFDLQSDVVIDPIHLYYIGGSVTGIGNTWITFTIQCVNNWSQASVYGYLTTDTGIYITDNSSNKIIVKANI